MRNRRFWLGLAVSLVALYIAFRGIDFNQLWSALTQANYLALVPALMVIFIAQLARAHRWGLLFYPDVSPPLDRTFSALSIGYLVNTILPARIGDIVRAVLLGGRQGPKVAQALSTIVIERALDVFAIVTMLVLVLPFVSLTPLLQRSATTVVIVFLVLIGALWAIVWQRQRAMTYFAWGVGRIPRINGDVWTNRVEGLIDGLQILHAPRQLFVVGVWSLVIWGVGGAFYNYLVMRAFGLQDFFGSLGGALVAATFVQVVVALGATVPSSPGYVGVYHAGVVLALGAFGVPHTEALAYALVAHAANFGLLILIGAFYLWREGLNLGQLTGPGTAAADYEQAAG